MTGATGAEASARPRAAAVALREILGDQAEGVLLELGGADVLDALVMMMPHRDWLIGTNDDGLPVGGPPDGPLIPLPDLWRVMCEAMASQPEGSALDLETLEVVGADGSRWPWEVTL